MTYEIIKSRRPPVSVDQSIVFRFLFLYFLIISVHRRGSRTGRWREPTDVVRDHDKAQKRFCILTFSEQGPTLDVRI